MYKLSIKTLLHLMTGLIAISLVIPLTFVVLNQNQAIKLLGHEKIGTTMIPQLQKINILLAEHRGTNNMYLNGDSVAGARLQNLAEKIQLTINNSYQDCLKLSKVLNSACNKLQKVNSLWQGLDKNLSETESFAAHTLLITDIRAIQTHIADISNLSLDSTLATYYLSNNIVKTLPDLIEKIAQLRGFSSGILAQKKISDTEKAELAKLSYAVHLAMQTETFELQKVFESLPAFQSHLLIQIADIQALTEKLSQITQQNIINAEQIDINNHAFFEQATDVINHVMNLYTPIVKALNNELDQRIAFLKWQRDLTVAGFVMFNLLVIGFISLVIRRINLPLKNAQACFKEISAGHYDYPIQIIYQDEIGCLLYSLDLMRNRLVSYVEQLTDAVNNLAEAQRIGRMGNWNWDIVNDTLVCSEEVYRIFGVVATQCLYPNREGFLQILPESERAKVKAEIDKALQTPGYYVVDYRIHCADGSDKIITQHIETQFNELGKPVRMIGTVQDVTERKQAVQALKESEERWKFAIEGAGDGIWDWNLRTGKVIYSKLWKQMIGYAEDEISDDVSEWTRLSHPDEIEAVNKRLEDYFNGKTTNYTCESRLRCKDGSWKWILDRGMVVSWDEQGKPLRMIGIHTDITNRKRIEQEMRDAKIAAEQASQAKSQFLANMSHEIRTPMNAILGFSSILSDLITDTIQRYYLDAITKSGKTLLQLINDILDLSKIEAGKFIVQYTPVTIKTLLDEIEIIFSQKFNDKSINFSVEIAEDIPAYLLLDEIRLRQILLNLVGNAVKFTESGFIKISVAAEPCECGSAVHLIISVCDSGIGIAKDQQEQIFAAFTQQKQQDVKYGGTGLGLTICKRLLELMGGDITVESEQGKGSCFKLSLKNIRIVEKQHFPLVNDEGLAKNSLDFEPAMILLVDDLPFNRQLIKAYLAEFKELRVVEADSGDLALRLLKQCHFDLILMDRILPGEDGDSICRKIKALPCCGTTPIIMITASVLEVTEQQFQPAYDLQLDKPVNKEQLLSAMQTFLRTKIGTQIKFESDATFPNYASCAVATKQLKALTFLLQQDYQARIALLSQSEIFDLTTILEIAEQLIQLAELHHCELLHIWAKNLKTQAELFDLVETSRTLKSFDELLTQL